MKNPQGSRGLIHSTNAQNLSYRLKVNELGDLITSGFCVPVNWCLSQTMCGVRSVEYVNVPIMLWIGPRMAVTPVTNQGQCASCLARHRQFVAFEQQQLVDFLRVMPKSWLSIPRIFLQQLVFSTLGTLGIISPFPEIDFCLALQRRNFTAPADLFNIPAFVRTSLMLLAYLHVVLPATQPTFVNKHAPSLNLRC